LKFIIEDNAMIRNSIDIATRVSLSLSAVIEGRVSDPDAEQPITLTTVRHFVAGLLPAAYTETEQMHHFDISESLLDELDALIEEFDGDALAIDFVQDVCQRTAFPGH